MPSTRKLIMSSLEQIISKEVSLHHRDNFWFQHFGAIPQWLKIESVIFHTLDQLCPDYHGGFWSFCTLSNQGAYLYPDLSEEHMLLINSHNGHEAQVSPQAMGIVVCLLVFSVWSFKTESEVMCERFYQLRDFASQHPEAEAIFYLID